MAMLSWHIVGQKILCVNNGPLRSDTGKPIAAPELTKGPVYTISCVRLSELDGRGVICVEEINFDENKYSGYDAARFEPVRATP